MTREQLDLVIEYINLKAALTARAAINQPACRDNYDRLAEIIGELEESTEN